MEEVANLTLTITRNLAALDLVAFADLQNTINNAVYLGFSPKTLKVDTLEATYTYENGVYFWAVKCVLERCPAGETWVRRVLDIGFQEIKANGKPGLITDDLGKPFSTPQLLDGKGKALPQGGTPVFLQVQTNEAVNFLLLNLF
jgi:hypothetical protein